MTKLLFVCITTISTIIVSVLYRQKIQNLELIDAMILLSFCLIIGFIIIIGCIYVNKINQKNDNSKPHL